jgi:hypothetical protein
LYDKEEKTQEKELDFKTVRRETKNDHSRGRYVGFNCLSPVLVVIALLSH